MALDKYRSMRDFNHTPEPSGSSNLHSDNRAYFFHKHQARRLHYDLRLELNGVLKSWAIPKGPSLNPVNKRLAVQVEDHPLEYGSFEGIIPEGQYGSGTVMLWDSGTWVPDEDPVLAYEKGALKFTLFGKKLTGRWVLVHIHTGTDHKNWLLIKENDQSASSTEDITLTKKSSVLSGLDIDMIRTNPSAVWDSNQRKSNTQQVPDHRESLDPSVIPGAYQESIPMNITPQSAQPVEKIPDGDSWLHEIKYDGYRILCFNRNSTTKLFTRNQKEWTDKFTLVAKELQSISLPDCVLDGEMVVQISDGSISFQALQNSMKGNTTGTLIYYVFDILYFKNYALTSVSLLNRKDFLKQLFSRFLTNCKHIRYSEHFTGNGHDVFEHACKLHYEGIISKLSTSIYEQRRTFTWLKTKCVKRQEFVIIGYTDPSSGRAGFGALHLGYYSSEGKMIYCGKVGTGFDYNLLATIFPMLKIREQKYPPFTTEYLQSSLKQNHWIKPELVAEIEYLSFTEDGLLRQPSFIGLREDKRAIDVHLEKPSDTPEIERTDTAITFQPASDQSVIIAGISITNADKILYTKPIITKKQLGIFYETIAERILPFLINRPLVLVRCPTGLDSCFYQKHLLENQPESLHKIPIKEQQSSDLYSYITDIHGLISLVQLSVLEIHLWGSTIQTLEFPDMLVFDLDPGDNVPWVHIIEASLLLRDILHSLELISFVKLSGGKGLHVIAPLQPIVRWDTVKTFSKKIALLLTSQFPKRFVATTAKVHRNGKIFVDYIRNTRGATTVSPYSTRARPGCPVSLPVQWEDLSSIHRADFFSIDFLKHYQSTPWSGFFDVTQSITDSMINAPILNL